MIKKKQVGQKEIKKMPSKKNNNNIGVKACAERTKEIEEKPDPQKNKGRLPLGQDLSHLGCQLVRKMPK